MSGWSLNEETSRGDETAYLLMSRYNRGACVGISHSTVTAGVIICCSLLSASCVQVLFNQLPLTLRLLPWNHGRRLRVELGDCPSQKRFALVGRPMHPSPQ